MEGLKWNHRLRLATITTATVSIALASVFFLVVFFLSEQALNRRFIDLENSVKRISTEWKPVEPLIEVVEDFPGIEVAIYKPDGKLVASSTVKVPSLVNGRSKRNQELKFGMATGSNIYVGVSSWTETEAGLTQLTWVLVFLWLPLTLLTAAVSWYGGGLILKPVKELVASAEKLSGTKEGEALTTTDNAEIASLTHSLNQLIKRVRISASLQEQFASDAAHELRTPLALMQTRIEGNLIRTRTLEEHVDSQTAVLSQIERLTSIVERLLQSARHLEQQPEVIQLDEAVQSAVDDWIELREFPKKRIRLTLHQCLTRILPEEVAIVIRNIIDNSFASAPIDSIIVVTLEVLGKSAKLSVQDEGPGVPIHEANLVFERFYRMSEEMGRSGGGAGIGLSVVRRIVTERGGTVQFVECSHGAKIEVQLPVMART